MAQLNSRTPFAQTTHPSLGLPFRTEPNVQRPQHPHLPHTHLAHELDQQSSLAISSSSSISTQNPDPRELFLFPSVLCLLHHQWVSSAALRLPLRLPINASPTLIVNHQFGRYKSEFEEIMEATEEEESDILEASN